MIVSLKIGPKINSVQQMGPGGEGDQAPDHGRGQVPHEERHDIHGGDTHLKNQVCQASI